MENPSSTYRTKDLYLASYLFSEGIELSGSDRVGSVYWFVFANKVECERLANLYWTDRANSKIKSFVEAIRSLKDIIFAKP